MFRYRFGFQLCFRNASFGFAKFQDKELQQLIGIDYLCEKHYCLIDEWTKEYEPERYNHAIGDRVIPHDIFEKQI